MRKSLTRTSSVLAAAVLTASIGALSLGTVPSGANAGVDTGDDRDRPGAEQSTRAPLVIGHRGASGYRPEHTLAAYELAARMGADFIEPDIVSTRDGVLVARHENEISGTTDVADRPEFADRRTTKTIDGVSVTGWFTEDLTLAELKTLRAKERLPAVRQESTVFDGRYDVPTLQEVLDLRARLSRELRREIGVYPETKHPTYFDRIGLSMEEPLLRTLRRNGLNERRAPVFVQSFETTNLRDLRRLGLRARVVQLIGGSGAPYDLVAAGDPRTYDDLVTRVGLRGIARYADGIGPDKLRVIPRRPDGTLGVATTLVRDAHRAGLLVHPYTFRAENTFLPADFRLGPDPTDFGRAIDEQQAYLRAGIDGFFTDQPDIGVAARDELAAARAS